MTIKYRVDFGDSKWIHYDFVSMTTNPGWLTCWHVDSDNRQIGAILYYPNERITEVLQYEIKPSNYEPNV